MDFYKELLLARYKVCFKQKLKFYDKGGNENKDITVLMKSNTGRKLITQILNSEFWGISEGVQDWRSF